MLKKTSLIIGFVLISTLLLGCTANNTAVGPQGETGPQGLQGLPGPQGLTGDTGTPGISGYEIVSNTETFGLEKHTLIIDVECPKGKKVLGGGCGGTASYYYPLIKSGPTPLHYKAGWSCAYRKDPGSFGPEAFDFTAYAICANVT